ncbi:peroxiredoxin-like family protein [Parapedobacter indicus]|uniref:thioredoxin-dependent peroxiredoxin n=1 Tax=Parapedobacter indicus TaxID=1477437 RepID=A0A1I3UF28_9SPHI|nr:peroxiredoxin-like family protein [Parapedobacter indicus]PPK99264.1 peroxiredoxin [Parapedobacter indicus]SFJ81259.1 Peroxiredoxin [Parapedobacter indicus]
MNYKCILLGLFLLPVFGRAQNHSVPEKPEDISPLLIGESIPMISLKDAMGHPFSLTDQAADTPTILVFYRGGWCPFCTKQLAGLQEILPDLKAMGYQLWAVSTDAPEGLTASAAKQNLDYLLLSDADLTAAKLFGIAFKAPVNYRDLLPKTSGGMNKELLLPVPSVFIIDKRGVIRFEYINPDFKQRLDSGLLMAVARQLQTEL